MGSFSEMLRKVTSSPCHDQMQRSVAPLNDHFGINHFWYYRITYSGHYSYLGTHSAWNEFCFDKALLSNFPCLRHPEALQNGINLMKASDDLEYKRVLGIAWDKFNINFNINLLNRISDGIEAFGFATRFNDPYAEQKLLNELPLLRSFIKMFRTKNRQLFQLLDDNQVCLPAVFGSVFYERPKTFVSPLDRDKFLRKMGFEDYLFLTEREKDVLKYLSSGYPAAYIAQQLQLSCRTVENYILTIKCKLSCKSKVELIRKANEIDGILF